MPSLHARPWAKTITEAAYRDILIGGDGCWEAQNSDDGNGYHRMKFRGKVYLLHRICAAAWLKFYRDRLHGRPAVKPA